MADPNTDPGNDTPPKQEASAPPPLPGEAAMLGFNAVAGEGRSEPAAVSAPAAKPKRGILSHAAAVTSAGLAVGAMCVAGPTAAKLLPSDSLVGDVAEAAAGVLVVGAAGAYGSKKASDAFRSTPGKKHGVMSRLVDATGVLTVPVAAVAGGTAVAAVGEMEGVGGNAAEFATGAGWAAVATAAGTKKIGDTLKNPDDQPGQGQGGGEIPVQALERNLLESGAILAGKGYKRLKEGFEKGKGGDGPGKA